MDIRNNLYNLILYMILQICKSLTDMLKIILDTNVAIYILQSSELGSDDILLLFH